MKRIGQQSSKKRSVYFRNSDAPVDNDLLLSEIGGIRAFCIPAAICSVRVQNTILQANSHHIQSVQLDLDHRA